MAFTKSYKFSFAPCQFYIQNYFTLVVLYFLWSLSLCNGRGKCSKASRLWAIWLDWEEERRGDTSETSIGRGTQGRCSSKWAGTRRCGSPCAYVSWQNRQGSPYSYVSWPHGGGKLWWQRWEEDTWRGVQG